MSKLYRAYGDKAHICRLEAAVFNLGLMSEIMVEFYGSLPQELDDRLTRALHERGAVGLSAYDDVLAELKLIVQDYNAQQRAGAH